MIPAFNTPISVVAEGEGYRDPITGEWNPGETEVVAQTLGHIQPIKEGQTLTLTQTGQFYETEQVVVYIRGSFDFEAGTLIYTADKWFLVTGAQDWTLPRSRQGRHTKLLCALYQDTPPDIEIPPYEPT